MDTYNPRFYSLDALMERTATEPVPPEQKLAHLCIESSRFFLRTAAAADFFFQLFLASLQLHHELTLG